MRGLIYVAMGCYHEDYNGWDKQQKRNVKTILGINGQSMCKPRFKTLGIMTLTFTVHITLNE